MRRSWSAVNSVKLE
uniref:Uncharacterized protein n=1 Tax=Arundo donax TaxID=35708 RepID=A0A0A9H4L7_ARUDO